MSEKKAVLCRNVKIGGGAPVSIQSMTNTPTADVKATMEQIWRLEEAGCQIVRMAVPDMEAARALYDIRKQTDLPLVADIHFDHRLALEAIRAGMDKIRINPGNIGSQDKGSGGSGKRIPHPYSCWSQFRLPGKRHSAKARQGHSRGPCRKCSQKCCPS